MRVLAGDLLSYNRFFFMDGALKWVWVQFASISSGADSGHAWSSEKAFDLKIYLNVYVFAIKESKHNSATLSLPLLCIYRKAFSPLVWICVIHCKHSRIKAHFFLTTSRLELSEPPLSNTAVLRCFVSLTSCILNFFMDFKSLTKYFTLTRCYTLILSPL